MIAPGQQINSEEMLVEHNSDGTHKAFALSGTQIVAGSIAADKIFVGSLSALSANLGTITSGMITGATIRTADAGARVLMDQLGIRQYNASNVQTAELKNDGSGWLGSQSVFQWNNAGVIQLNGSAVMPNTITGGKVNYFNVPVIDGLVITNNSPSAGYVAWNSFTLTHQGMSYTIAAGNTNKKFIYWKKATSTTVLQTSDTPPTRANDQFLVIFNDGGTGIASLFANIIYADYINAVNLAAISADLGTITAGMITGATIQTAASNPAVKLDPNGVRLDAATGKFTAASIEWYAGVTRKLSIGTDVDLGAPVSAYLSTPLAINLEATYVTIATQAGGAASLLVKGGLNVGTPVDAGTGAIKCSSDISAGGGLNVGTASGAGTGDIKLTPTTIGVYMNRIGSGNGNGVVWGYFCLNAAAGDNLVLGNSSSAYTTGGTLTWIGNSQAFLYYPGSLKVGTGVGATPTLVLDGSQRLGVGITPTEKLDVSGYINASSGYKCGGTAPVPDGTYHFESSGTTGKVENITFKGGMCIGIGVNP